MEKIWDEFLSPKFSLDERPSNGFEAKQKDLRVVGFSLLFNKSGLPGSSSRLRRGRWEGVGQSSPGGPIRNGVIRMIDFGLDNVYHFR